MRTAQLGIFGSKGGQSDVFSKSLLGSEMSMYRICMMGNNVQRYRRGLLDILTSVHGETISDFESTRRPSEDERERAGRRNDVFGNETFVLVDYLQWISCRTCFKSKHGLGAPQCEAGDKRLVKLLQGQCPLIQMNRLHSPGIGWMLRTKLLKKSCQRRQTK